MSAITRFHEAANDALVKLSEHCPPGAKLALVIYTPGEPERDIVIEDQGLDKNEVVSALHRRDLSIDGDNTYKRDLCDSIAGALALGKQNNNPPPADHWGQRFWDIGRAEGELQEELLLALIQVTNCLSKALTGGEVSAAAAGTALATAGAMIEKHYA